MLPGNLQQMLEQEAFVKRKGDLLQAIYQCGKDAQTVQKADYFLDLFHHISNIAK